MEGGGAETDQQSAGGAASLGSSELESCCETATAGRHTAGRHTAACTVTHVRVTGLQQEEQKITGRSIYIRVETSPVYK